MILPATVGTYHGLNCFSYMKYMLQTNMYYKDIAKFLHPLNICIEYEYLIPHNCMRTKDYYRQEKSVILKEKKSDCNVTLKI